MPFSNPFPDVPSSNTLEPRWRLVFKDGTAGYSLTIKDNDADADENKHKDENKDKEKNKDEDRTSKDYNDETADTIIVSSDGVKFWIPSYVLKFGSVALRDGFNSSSETKPVTKIEFTDVDDETEESVGDFLDVLTAKEDLAWLNGKNPTGTEPSRPLRLFRLLEKYDCGIWLEATKKRIRMRQALRLNDSPHYLWKLSLYLRDDLGAQEGLPLAAACLWQPVFSGGRAAELSIGVAGKSCLDITAMSQAELESYPTKYLVALMRASSKLPRGFTSNCPEWKFVANEFYRLLTGVRLPDPMMPVAPSPARARQPASRS